MSAATIEDELDAIEIVVEQDEHRRVIRGHYRLYVGRLVVAQEEVLLPATTYFRSILMSLRAGLRSFEATARPVVIAVPDATVVRFLEDPDRPLPRSDEAAELLLEVRDLIEDKAPAAVVRYRYTGGTQVARRRSGPSDNAIVAPAIVKVAGRRCAGYILARRGVTQSRLFKVDPTLTDEEALLAVVVVATRGLDGVENLYVFSESAGLRRLLDRDESAVVASIRAARLVRNLARRFVVKTADATYESVLAAGPSQPDAWAAAG